MFQESSATRWPTQPTQWTRYHDKLFERALLVVPEDLPDRWEKIADQVPGKSAVEVREHYEALVHDVFEIDSGRVEVPSYVDDSVATPPSGGAEISTWDNANQISFGSKPKQQGDNERKKGTPWTEEEHRFVNASTISLQLDFFFFCVWGFFSLRELFRCGEIFQATLSFCLMLF